MVPAKINCKWGQAPFIYKKYVVIKLALGITSSSLCSVEIRHFYTPLRSVKNVDLRFDPTIHKARNNKTETRGLTFIILLHIVDEVITYFKTTDQYQYIPSFEMA